MQAPLRRHGLAAALANANLASRTTFAAAFITLLPAQTHAQQELPEVRVSGRQDTLGRPPLDTPIGTGSRLGLSARETPGSVTLIDRQNIEQRDASNTQESLIAAPGLHASPTAAPPGFAGYVAMRGFSGSQVTQLFNGITVQYDAIAARPIDAWMLDRVEVLGGPSSYLYGSGAVGGTINYVSRVASRETLSQDAYLSYGSFDTTRAAYGLNVALGGTEASNWLRVDVSRQQSGGYVNPGQSESNAVSFSLLSDITRNFFHTLAYESYDEKRLPYWGTPLRRPATDGAFDPATARINYNVGDGLYGNQIRWLRSIAEIKLSKETSLTNTFYGYDAERLYRNVEVYRWNAANTAIERGSLFAQRHGHRLLGNRFEFAHKSNLFGRDSQWAGGLDVSMNRQTTYPYSASNITPTTGAALDTVNPYSPSTRSFFTVAAGVQDATNPQRENRIKSAALFIENRTRLTPQLSLVAGLRQDRIEVGIQTRRAPVASPVVLEPAFFEINYAATTGRLGAVYDLNQNANLYVQYSTSADPAAGILTTGTFAQFQNFPLTTGTQWEVGSKFDFWDKRASATMAAYRIVRRNLTLADPANPAGPPLAVGQQSASGIEASVGAKISPAWRVQANAGYANAKFDTFTETVGGVAVSRAGNAPANTPKLVANAWLTWSGAPGWEAGAGYRHVGSVYSNAANVLTAPGYQLLDLFASYKLNRNTSLTARVRNATDKLYVSNVTGNALYIFGEPRSVELALRASF